MLELLCMQKNMSKRKCFIVETTAEGFTLKEYAENILLESENIAGFRYKGGLKKEEKDRLKFEIAKRMGRKYDTVDLIRLGIYYILRLNMKMREN